MRKKRIILAILLWILFFIPCFSSQLEKNKSKEPRPIETADTLAWKSIGFAGYSNDGQWFAHTISSRKGYREIVIKETKGEKEFRFKLNASGISFSEDSKWAAFTIKPGKEEEKKLKKENKKIYNNVGLVNLSTGEKIEFDKAERFTFSGENSAWIALHKYPPEGQEKEKEKWRGRDLILHELASSKEINIGNVSEFAFDKKGLRLAWIVDAKEKSGNGIQLRNMKTGVVLPLDNDKAVYKKLKWTEKGDGLAVLKGKEDKNYGDKLYSVVGFRNFSAQDPEMIICEPAQDKNFPKGMTISPHRAPMWTQDLSGIFFGIHELKRKEKAEKKQEQKEKTSEQRKEGVAAKTKKAEEEDLPDLILWHWLDKRLQSQQQVEEEKDKAFSYLCIYRLNQGKFIRLADEEIKEVVPVPKHRWAIGFDQREYLYMSTLNGRLHQDIYVIDLKTGERRLAVKKCRKFRRPRWYYSLSPDGTHFLYYNNENGHFYTYEMESGQTYNITQDVPTSFINKELSYNLVNPPIKPVGWAKDGKSVLLYDNWDVWKVPVHGGKGINLTLNGKKEGIRYRKRFRLDYKQRSQFGPTEKGIDLSDPIYFEAYGEWTKKGGIARIDNRKPGAKVLFWDDALFNNLFKAKNSNTYFYSKETYDDLGYYVTDNSLQNGQKILERTSQQKEFLWSSGSMLINYKSARGDKLQAALFLPANYEKGESYPTVVYIYEKLSAWMHRYLSPGFSALSKPVYTSRGYAVLMPDIVYEVNDPGMSAVQCVLPAIEAAVATGVVDKDRIGIHGHSMGGWETAFLITQTNIFKAAAAGAPLTDLISMYGSIYGRTGGSNGALFESSQGRIDRNYCENLEPFVRNSPVLHAHKVKTPLLILHNDKDGAVDWNQGVEYFNILRRLQKPVIMLQYKGEGHILRKFVNQKDYSIRVMEFFDHYLMGKPAPKWLKEGVPYLKIKEHLKERSRKQSTTNIS